MSGGMKEMLINPLERALSVDVNRLQKFKSADIAEFFRYWFDVSTSSDNSGGLGTEPSGIETPLRAEIVNGFCVKPQLGNNSCFVDPGVLYAMLPDAAADDSDYKYVHDLGVQTVGQILIAANSSGNTRIDVIECQPTLTTFETDSRDIYNTTTQLFSATTVTKAQGLRMTYRVRSGTSGGGFASVGLAQGWLPLCVAVVPNTSANNDTVTFYDVRPLLIDRVKSPFNHSLGVSSHCDPSNAFYFMPNGGSTSLMQGEARFNFKGRVAGGVFPLGTAPFVEAGFPGTIIAPPAGWSGGSYGMWLCFPFGLPRWCQYTTAGSGTRVPGPYRGLLLQTHVMPADASGVAVAVISLASTGLGGNALPGDSCFVGSAMNSGGAMANGNRYLFDNGHTSILTDTAGVNAFFFNFGFNDGDNVFPANAKSLLTDVLIHWTWTPSTTPWDGYLRIKYNFDQGAGYVPASPQFGDAYFMGFGQAGFHRPASDGEPGRIFGRGEMPLLASFPGQLGNKARVIRGAIEGESASAGFNTVTSAFGYTFTISGYTL